MVIHHADRLHRRVERRRPDEGEPSPLELLGEGLGLWGDRGEVAERLRRRRRLLGRGGPDQPIERLTARVKLAGGLCVRDRRLDLAAVADDAGVREQSLHVLRSVSGDLLDVEAVEGTPEVLPLAQDREPGEPGLEGLQSESFEELVLAVERPPPFAVVVADVLLAAERPPTAALAIGSFLDSLHGW